MGLIHESEGTVKSQAKALACYEASYNLGDRQGSEAYATGLIRFDRVALFNRDGSAMSQAQRGQKSYEIISNLPPTYQASSPASSHQVSEASPPAYTDHPPSYDFAATSVSQVMSPEQLSQRQGFVRN
jgi:hypothetical protein